MNQLPPVCPTYAPDPAAPLRLCADEMWSFVRSKKQQRWLWWVEDATTGQVVAFVFGRRTHATFRRLQAVLAAAGWAVADRCVERKHLTLRTRINRLTRKTICFSKKQFFHDGLITLFIAYFFF